MSINRWGLCERCCKPVASCGIGECACVCVRDCLKGMNGETLLDTCINGIAQATASGSRLSCPSSHFFRKG